MVTMEQQNPNPSVNVYPGNNGGGFGDMFGGMGGGAIFFWFILFFFMMMFMGWGNNGNAGGLRNPPALLCVLALVTKQFLDELHNELLLADFPSSALRLLSKVGFQLLEELLGNLNCKGSGCCHGDSASFVILGQYFCDVVAQGLARLLLFLPHLIVQADGNLGT